MKLIRRTLQNALDAWWVLLIIAVYMVLAAWLTGTSCLLASVTGIPCPGCGMTRAALSLMRGDFCGSLHYHPLLIPAALFACVYIISSLTRAGRPRYMDRLLIITAVLFVAVYAVRMVFWFPCTVPMAFNEKAILPRLVSVFISKFSGGSL